MASKDVAPVLAKEFVPVKLDYDRAKGAEQIERGYTRERANFVIDWSPAVKEEALDGIQRGLGQILEDPEAERLGDWRIGTVEDHVGAGALHPFSAAVRKQPLPCLCEGRSGVQRRRDVHVSLEDPYRTDDRRFGLGRRWEDWCRPAQEDQNVGL